MNTTYANTWLPLMILIPSMFFVGFLYILFMISYIRVKSKGAVIIRLWGVDKLEITSLIKLKGRDFWIWTSHDKKGHRKYVIDMTKQHFSIWPGMAPKWLQVLLPTYYYRDDQPEPIDPRGEKLARVISPEMLNAMTNEAYLAAKMAEARQAAEGNLVGFRRAPLFIMIIAGVGLIATIAIGYLSYANYQKIEEMYIAITAKG